MSVPSGGGAAVPPGGVVLEDLLGAALDRRLTPLIADAAALKVGARVGSRRIRRRRRVAAGVLAVAVVGGVGALTLPRGDGDRSPRPLPVATPTVSDTGDTRRPTGSSTASPSGRTSVTPTPSLSLSSGATPTGTPTGTASPPRPTGATTRAGDVVRTPRTTGSAPSAAPSSGLGYSTDTSTWDAQGAYRLGDWLVSTDGFTDPYVTDFIPAGRTWTEPPYARLAPPYDEKETLGGWPQGLVAQRQWSVSNPADSSWSLGEAVTGWAPGVALERMRETAAGGGAGNVLLANDDRFIENLDSIFHYGARGLVRIGDVIVGVYIYCPRTETLATATERLTRVLDEIEAVAKARGTR